MNICDILLLFFLSANISSGIQKGLVHQLVSVAEILASMYVAYLLMNFSLDDFFFKHSVLDFSYSKAIVFLVIYAMTRFVVHLAGRLISFTWKVDGGGSVDIIAGGVLGAIQGVSEIFILLIAVGMFCPVTSLTMLAGSRIIPLLNGLALDCFQRITTIFLI